jgi:hypothetical protein
MEHSFAGQGYFFFPHSPCSSRHQATAQQTPLPTTLLPPSNATERADTDNVVGPPDLPNEIMAAIFDFVAPEAFHPFRLVCRQWNHVAEYPVRDKARPVATKPPPVRARRRTETYGELLARGGDLYLLRWAHASGCPLTEFVCDEAARGGHLDVLQWARENGAVWSTSTCAHAAGGGHLEVLQWLRANGCPWDERTCATAAKGGHLEVLQWAHANGCPMDQRPYDDAANAEVFKWVCAHGCNQRDPLYLEELDLDNLDGYCRVNLERYCWRVGIAVEGRSKQGYIKAILTFFSKQE